MSEQIYAGLTSQTVDVFLPDSSSSTGGGLTGLVYNTSNLTCYYRKGATGTPTAITLATQTVGGAWTSGGFVEVDATNMPGVYRLDLPNAAVDTSGFVTVYFRGATNLAPTPIRIDCRALRAVDNSGNTIAPASATTAISNKIGTPAVTIAADATTNKAAIITVVNDVHTDVNIGLARLGAWTGTGVNTVLGAFKALLNKLSSLPSDIGGTMNPATDSLEPIADAVDLVPTDKDGYKLASDGLDAVSTTGPVGVASNFREMLVQLWRRFFKKAHLDITNGTLKTYADDGTTVVTTQVVTTSSTDEDVGAAS